VGRIGQYGLDQWKAYRVGALRRDLKLQEKGILNIEDNSRALGFKPKLPKVKK